MDKINKYNVKSVLLHLIALVFFKQQFLGLGI